MKTKINTPEILGIDLGNTLFNKENYPDFPDSLRVVRRLAIERFGFKNIHIVSRVTPEQEKRALIYVSRQIFKDKTRITLDRVHFCRERHEKGPICEILGITHFIDDRPDVLIHMPTNVKPILFNPRTEDRATYTKEIRSMYIVENWLEIERLLLQVK